MPEDVLKEKIKSQLLEAVESTRDRYTAGKCGADEYVQALKRLNDFLIDGAVPQKLKRGGKAGYVRKKPNENLEIRMRSTELRARSATLREESRVACEDSRDSRAFRLLKRLVIDGF